MGDIGDAFGSFITVMFVGLAIFVPLGMWKLVEIIIWLFTNVKISF